MKTIALQDANILIDLVKTGLLDHCLALPYRFTTTDIILDELHAEQFAIVQQHISSGKFDLILISAKEMTAIQEMIKQDTRLSEQDWSAYYYAKEKQALLLTGDKRLRSIATANGLTVCGIFWVIDQLVDSRVVSTADAYVFLQALKTINKRLPQEEYDKRIVLWG